MLKITKDIFIERSNRIHSDKYDYSKTKFDKITDLCIVTCSNHGDYKCRPFAHMKGRGRCPVCDKKIDTKTFTEKAILAHGDKYDYSKSNYLGCNAKVLIICKSHGEFWQLPDEHWNGKGCIKCSYEKLSLSKSIGREEFIRKSKKVHGDKYDYSNVNYKSQYNKVKIICPEHGEFSQTAKNHMNGRGCKECGLTKQGLNSRIGTDEFIKRANLIHNNKYDYSEVNLSIVKSKIHIICPEHGKFWQIPSDHLRGNGCRKCGDIVNSAKRTKSTENFIERAIKIHGDKFDYSKVEYSGLKNNVLIICPIHGEFLQSSDGHLSGNGCPKCKESKGEKKIQDFFLSNNISYKKEYRFKDCICKKPLPFDFYLPDFNMCIEYDGEQHFRVIERSKDKNKNKQTFINIGINDIIKTTYCINNNINLLRIDYLDFNNIEKILSTFLHEK